MDAGGVNGGDAAHTQHHHLLIGVGEDGGHLVRDAEEDRPGDLIDHGVGGNAFQADAADAGIGFCVMGGIFSEGIDLKEDRLIGVIIIGTGLPQVGEERELLSRYFNEKSGRGFEYAYLYPGMNKVLQAAGRVIRTEKDRGVIALLDERFNYSQYRKMFPREWHNCSKTSLNTIVQQVEDFWTDKA